MHSYGGARGSWFAGLGLFVLGASGCESRVLLGIDDPMAFDGGAEGGTRDAAAAADAADAARVDGGPADAGKVDASVAEDSQASEADGDAATGDGAARFSLTASVEGFPLTVAPVLFHDQSGAVIAQPFWDPGGPTIVSAARAPRMATLNANDLAHTSVAHQLVITFVGLEDGDHVKVDVPSGAPDGSTKGLYAVSGPTYPSATSYRALIGGDRNDAMVGSDCVGVATPAASNRWSVDVSAIEACVREGAPLLVAARGRQAADTRDRTLAYSHDKSLHTASPDKQPLSVATWREPDYLSLAVNDSSMPAASIPPLLAQLTMLLKGGAFVDDPPLAVTSLPFASDFADELELAVTFPELQGSVALDRRVKQRRQPVSGTAQLDLHALLPPLNSVSIVNADSPRPTIRIAGSAAHSAADAGIIELAWHLGSADGLLMRWIFIVPPTTSELVVPALPDALPYNRARVGLKLTRVVWIDSAQLQGYADFKRIPQVVRYEPSTEWTAAAHPLEGPIRFPLDGTLRDVRFSSYCSLGKL